MKIALVVHDFDPGFGQGRYTVELARRLAPRHDVQVYANRFAVPLEPNWTFQKVRAWRATALTTVLTFPVHAERLLRARSHDLIHAQGLTCWRADVITAHICNAARARHTAPARARDRILPAVVVPLERRFYRQPGPRHLIAVSRAVAEDIAAEYDWRRPATIIYHGIDGERFRPPADPEVKKLARHRYALDEQVWVWLFVGEAVKGLGLVIDQLPAFPGTSLLTISRSRLDGFRRQAKRLGVESRVRFQGPEVDLTPAYQAADVLVYPSDYDAFGLVVAEAMASGLPVVVGQGIGAAEWVVPGRNGMICDPAQPATLREALDWLQADPQCAHRLGQTARSTVQNHTWEACAAATEAVYQQVLAGPGGRA